MDWKSHMLVPLLLYIAIILIFQFQFLYSVQALFLVVFSAFLPELDHPRSVARRIFFVILFYAMVFAITIEVSIEIWLKFVVITVLLVLARYAYKKLPIKHRGKHSLHLWRYCLVIPTFFVFVFMLANINISLASFIIVGYGSHLALDKINKF